LQGGILLSSTLTRIGKFLLCQNTRGAADFNQNAGILF